MKPILPGALFAGALFLSAMIPTGDATAQTGDDSLAKRIGRVAGHLDLCSNHQLANELVEELSKHLNGDIIRNERRKLGYYDGTRGNCGGLASEVEDLLENVRNRKPKNEG